MDGPGARSVAGTQRIATYRRYYSLFTLFMLVTFECTVVVQRLKNLNDVRALQTPKEVLKGGAGRGCGCEEEEFSLLENSVLKGLGLLPTSSHWARPW